MNRSCRHGPAAALLLALVCAQPAWAAMYVDRSETLFRAGDAARQDIVITNPDPDPLYVKVEVTEVFHAGTPQEERRSATDAADIRLLATPNKLVIPPGEQRAVRLVNVAGHGGQERVFRVKFTPVVGQIEGESPGMAVKVVVAYDILAVVAPAAPNPALAASRDGQALTFQNTGNTNVYLFNGQQCPSVDSPATECTALPGNRVYPGATWSVSLPGSGPVDFFVTILGNNERRRFE